MNVRDLLAAFEKLAGEAEPFGGYPIVYLKPSRDGDRLRRETGSL